MSIELRGGYTTEHPRLDRIVQFDERSRRFQIIGAAGLSRPLRSYTWRCTPRFDQGNAGACVAYSLGHELAARAAEVKGITHDFLIREVYWEAQKLDPWDGGAYPSASPKYEGTSILAGIKALQKLPVKLFDGYRWAFSLKETLLGVGYHGPAVIGVPWFEGMMATDGDGYIRPEGAYLGGHAILLNGVDVKRERVRLHNSWGTSWGWNGECWMRFGDLEKVLQMEGEVAFLLKRKGRTL